MSAASPVRRPSAGPAVVNAQARPVHTPAPSAGSGRLEASDIPPLDTNMHDIEGLKPTLLSRLFDLFAPKR